MRFPIHVEQVNGHYAAVLLGDPTVRVTAPTRAEALVSMQNELHRRMQTGEIVWLDVPTSEPVDFVGILKGDPTLEELVADIYRRRDAEPYPGEE